MRRIWVVFVVVVTALVSCSLAQDAAPPVVVSMVEAIQKLKSSSMESVPRKAKAVNTQFTPPKHNDLAVTRLQDKLRDVVTRIWASLLDQQRLLILMEKGGIYEVLRIYADQLRGDIFAMTNMVANSGVLAILKQLYLEDYLLLNNLKDKLQRLVTKATEIDLMYRHLDNHMATNQSQLSPLVLEDFSMAILLQGANQNNSMLSSLTQLHSIMLPNKFDEPLVNDTDSGFFLQMYLTLKDKHSKAVCQLGQSPQQLLMNVYNLMALTDIKGYAMVQFAYMTRRILRKEDYSLESDLAIGNFESQAKEALVHARAVLSRMSRDFWVCDPSQQVEGSTYVRMTKLLQGHIENEVDMNNLGSCKESCSSYKVSVPQSCYSNLFCAKQPSCDGRLFDCSFYHADAWVCMSDSTDRKYDWIEYEDGTILGNKQSTCINKIKVDSWWRWLLYHCSYCLCKCDAPTPDSDRYWSLVPAVSDIDNNKIVVGARFVKKDRVIHIEIEQAMALPEGGIQDSSRMWVAAPTIDVSSNSSGFQKDQDYIVMSYEQRNLDLDLLEAPAGHVVTGLRLRRLGGHLNLEIRLTPITFTSGKLTSGLSTWHGNDNTPLSTDTRVQHSIIFPDVPTKTKIRSTILSGHNQFIAFDTTTAKSDVMQTTIPFMDAQPVSPRPGVWIAGVGLYHKGQVGYGGYVGISLKTYDLSQHLMLERDHHVYPLDQTNN